MNGKISLQSDYARNDILRITVKASNIEDHVLGTAFNLNFDSDALLYLRHEAGNFLEQGAEPFYLVQPKIGDQSRLIFGATLKNGDELAFGSGDLSYFYFRILKKSKVNFGFEDGVLATLKNGMRRNLNDIEWRDLALNLGNKAVTEKSMEDWIERDDNRGVQIDQNPLAADAMSDFISDNYSVLTVLLSLFLILLVSLRLRKII